MPTRKLHKQVCKIKAVARDIYICITVWLPSLTKAAHTFVPGSSACCKERQNDTTCRHFSHTHGQIRRKNSHCPRRSSGRWRESQSSGQLRHHAWLPLVENTCITVWLPSLTKAAHTFVPGSSACCKERQNDTTCRHFSHTHGQIRRKNSHCPQPPPPRVPDLAARKKVLAARIKGSAAMGMVRAASSCKDWSR